MANFYLCLLVFRILLPIIFGICIIFRPSGLSALYLIFLFLLPLIPAPTLNSMMGSTGLYLKFLIGISVLTATAQVAFQVVLASMPPYGYFLRKCEDLEIILRHVGFVRMDGIDAVEVITWISPEIVMLISSITIYIICHKLLTQRTLEESENEANLPQKAKAGKKKFSFLVAIGKYAVLLALCVAAVLRPSVPGGLYFLIFLSAATWWACYKQLGKGFGILMRCLMVVVFFHLCSLYTYQFQWPQQQLDPNSTYARYFGLTPLVTSSCDPDPRKFTWSNQEWASYANPIALYLLYYILALESKFLLKPQSQKKQGPFSRLEGSFKRPLTRQMSQRLSNRHQLMRTSTTRNKWQNATRKVRSATHPTTVIGETTPLIRGVSPSSKRYGSGHKKTTSVLQDSTGSVTVTGDNPDDIPMDQLGKGAPDEEYEPTLFEKIIFTLEYLLQVIIKSSYIATNIIMMAWSITYLSWITFVLLLWANLLWLVPNQRKSMLRSSPFLVIYAWFLLISAYIYSMNLNDDELPEKIDNINMKEIGFEKIKILPCNPLFVKCLFTTMFWVTLRQYMQERIAEKQSNALADMVAPLQITVGTAAGVNNEQEQGSKLMNKIGKILKNFLTRFWIWVVAITLFGVAITGERMTAFRILYMALFLFFVLSFQLSFRAWRKMMFGFWLTVIVVSMLILVMVYTYQFEGFPGYWEKYLKVTKALQADIGLEKFNIQELFVRLVTPTFFVIISVIQLHYFHKDFMELSDPRNASALGVELDQSSLQGGAVPNSERDETTTSSLKYDVTDTESSKTRFELCIIQLKSILNLMFLFLELHMPKIILFFLMLMCIHDKCALYLLLIILIVLGCTTGRPVLVFAIYCSSFLVSLMLLARMVYQIDYISPNQWNVTCEMGNDTKIENNAKWLGFNKISQEAKLPYLVRWNIIYILLVTIWSVVLVRQFNYRVTRGKPTTRAFFMFPKIGRVDADKDVWNCIKYLFNYGFYKFGVEICLMATVALIGFRMDMYSVIYSIWLCILFNLNRKKLARVWNFYMAFIAVFLPLQYIMTVGLPPTLCLLFPWDKEYWNGADVRSTEIYRRFQDWAYLLDSKYPPSAKKLICDFILLLLVSRQSVVFRIEKRYEGKDYLGGSNESIIHHAEQKGFENPVPDFISSVRSYLDVFKKGVFYSFLWITLAIVFLAGTNRVNIFSIGYLCGAFIFLWQGTDLYLRPIPKILKLWDSFLGYNVAVILIKTSLQIVGCIFIKEIPSYSCWVIQLFGIGCVKKFGNLAYLAGHEDLKQCQVPREFVGLVWDGLCFGFMIMQRRIFQSYNFFHMIDEIKAGTILASRGAELIEELRQKRMIEQEEQEHRVLEKIKAKMDKIKANQQKIQGANYKDSTNHYVEQQPPLAHSSSMSSCGSGTSQQTSPAGYHTPIDDEEHVPLTPRSSLIQPQAPSPYSAVMTVSLEGYLEPQRMSFSSPPNSELNPRPPSPDDSFPVFSPPPYDAAPPYAEAVSEPPAPVQRQTSIGPPWMQGSFVTPRQSIISYSSRSPLSHHEYTIFKGRPKYKRKEPKSYKQAVRSGDYYMFDDLDDDDDLDFIEDSKKDDEDKYKGQTVGELLSTAMKTDIGTSLRRHSETEFKRRSSMPLARQRSIVSARSQISAPYSAPPTIEEHGERSVKIIDERDIEPRPGTSRDDSSESASKTPPTCRKKFTDFWLFVLAFIQSSMISLTNFLNKYSKDYRYVIRVLAKEKKILKENTDYNVGLRLGSGQVWQPAASYNSLLRQSREDLVIATPSAGTFSPSDSYKMVLIEERKTSVYGDDVDEKPPLSEESSDTKALATTLPYSSDQDRRKASVLTVPEIRILAPSLERGLDSPFPPSDEGSRVDIEEYEGTELSSYDQPPIIRLLLAIWYIIMSRSEVVCYFIIFLNQIKSATFLSLPLPLMVFLWGTLTIPRPNKSFWVTIIAYTEIIVLIKCMFQFDIIPWNKNQAASNNPFFPPRIIGIERNKNYAIWDLLLLLVVFFHRFMLKTMGLWKTSQVPAVYLTDGEYRITPQGSLEPVEEPVRIKRQRNLKRYSFIKRITPSPMYKYQPKPKIKMKKLRSFFKFVKQLSPKHSENKTNGKNSPTRKSSDLQRLVEESEDQDDDKKEEPPSSIDESDTDNKLVSVTTENIEPMSNMPLALKMAFAKYGESFKIFFLKLRDPTSRVAADVYSYMFLCDFFNFFVILLGYSSFGTQQGDGGVSSYLEDNRVPVLFLLMLILQFMLIIVDRGIFLRKNIIAKIIFQFIQVFILHIWLFIIFPIMTERAFNSVIAPQMYYMVKCFYLLLSAYQIRCGYPTRILGNFLCKGYNYVNMFLFKIFMAIPFLFELRTVMDWMWTDTSMTVFDWIKMEDIFAHIFQLKCTRHVEDEYPQPRGEKKNPVVKYLMGGAILILIIAIIWFPLVFFSLGNAVGEANPPYDVTLEIRIGPYEPVYQMSAQSNSIYQFTDANLEQLKNKYLTHKSATTFISNYEAVDIAAVILSSDSANIWSISPPDRNRMVEEVSSEKPLTVRLEYKVSHKTSKPEDSGVIPDFVEIKIPARTNGKRDKNRENLLEMLGGKTSEPMVLKDLLPKFLKVTNRGTAKAINQLMFTGPEDSDEHGVAYREISLTLNTTNDAETVENTKEWWSIQENCSDYNYKQFLSQIPYVDCQSIILYTFNDKIFPSTLSILTAGGIVGLYTTLVFVASRFLRGFFADQCFKIMFEDMPYIDRVLQLCLDIYLVREAREFALEEDLFAKLVFLFRSPETMIKWTRPKEELDDDEDPEGDNA